VIRRIAFVAVLLASHAALNGQGSIATTKHNLSVGGPGTVRAQSETQICVFCHTPHNSRTQAPLWNRNDSGGTYTMYWSATMDAYSSPAAAPQPNGNSKLCLSCHDGTLALGATVASGTIPMSGGITTMPVTGAYFGLDLSGHHPVSFVVTSALVSTNNAKGDVPLKTVAQMRASTVIKLDPSDRVQCTSCHDSHKNPYGSFLRAASTDSICLGCHS
jgi:predicted CXXCH cytochrome family protein